MIGLFSFRGRASRLTYWRTALLCIALGALVVTAGYFAVIAIGPPGGLVFAALAPILLINLSVALRRLHDRGKGIGWLLLFQFGPLVTSALAQQLARAVSPILQLGSLPLSLISLGLSLWGLVEIGFLRGQPAANRFGDPAGV